MQIDIRPRERLANNGSCEIAPKQKKLNCNQNVCVNRLVVYFWILVYCNLAGNLEGCRKLRFDPAGQRDCNEFKY